jgi:CspA family cold shock protein
MTTGTVASFNAKKGYGFITPDDGGADCFVHITAIEASGIDPPSIGQRLSYDVLVARNGRVSAINLTEV